MDRSLGEVETLKKQVISWLDRWQDRELKLGLGVIYRKFQTLDMLGVKYHDVGVYRDLLDSLQNPDGGFRKPLDVHSNLFDTCFALELARILQRIQ